MDPANFSLGLKVKLSDVIKDEIAAISKNRGTRRAAVRRILTERGLGHVVQSMSSYSYVGVNESADELSKRKNDILQRLSDKKKPNPIAVKNDVLSYINYHKTPCYKKSPLIGSTKKKNASINEGKGQQCLDSDQEDISRCLPESVSSSDSNSAAYNSEHDGTANFTSSPSEWKFGKVPVIVLTPPSSRPICQDHTGRAETPATDSVPTTLHSAPSCPIEIGLAYNTYQKMVLEATSHMEDVLTSNKWQVISYLSGVPMQNFQNRVPEWYIAIQDILASLNMSEKVKRERRMQTTTRVKLKTN